ncbi:MAG: NUDIX hydrolase [Actinomycetota bacterium]
MPDTQDQVTRIAAYGLMIDADQILLCRISDQLPQDSGSWTLPGGGLEFGEDPASAMVREVHEETGLVVEVAGLAGVDSLVIEREGTGFHSIRILYLARILGGKLTCEVDGTTDLCEWHHIRDVQSLPVVDLVHRALALLPIPPDPQA